jgi:hypothetical protein
MEGLILKSGLTVKGSEALIRQEALPAFADLRG